MTVAEVRPGGDDFNGEVLVVCAFWEATMALPQHPFRSISFAVHFDFPHFGKGIGIALRADDISDSGCSLVVSAPLATQQSFPRKTHVGNHRSCC